jgi:hypothetical protein
MRLTLWNYMGTRECERQTLIAASIGLVAFGLCNTAGTIDHLVA